MRCFLTLLTLALPLCAQTSFLAIDTGVSGQPCCIAVDSAGDVYTVTTSNFEPVENITLIVITKTGPDNSLIYSFPFQSDGLPSAVAVDSQQNVFIAGNISAGATTNASISFVSKLNAAGTQILFTRLLGGTTGSGTSLNAVATDSAGNVYVAGSTTSSDYPVTPNAYQPAGPVEESLSQPSFAVVTELSADGADILYSTFIGNATADCVGGSSCIGVVGKSAANAVAIAPDESIVIAGATSTSAFPVTGGAFQTSCGCGQGSTNGFIASFRSNGTLNWSTYLGGSDNREQLDTLPSDSISSMAIEPDGSVAVAGSTQTTDFPVTPGAFQSTWPGAYGYSINLFISRFSADGSTLLNSTYLGGSTIESLSGLALDAQQNIWVAGVTQSSNFPIVAGSLSMGNSFVVKMNPALSQELQTQLLPNGVAYPHGSSTFTLDFAGNQVLFSPAGVLLRLPNTGAAGTTVLTQANSAAYTASGEVAPGELISLYGIGLGPNPGVGATLNSNNQLPTAISGTQVLIDGTAAPLLYAGPEQINAIVPFKISTTAPVSIQVMTASGSSETMQTVAATALPQIVSLYNNGSPAVIALNQDNSLNSPSNPAKAGSIVTVYALGTGLYSTPLVDGSITGLPLAMLQNPVTVLFDGQPAQILYAGSAPDLVAGVTQINFRIPSAVAATNTVEIQSAAGTSGALLAIAATN